MGDRGACDSDPGAATALPAPPVEVQPDGDLEPAPQELVREWCAQVRTMGPDELNAIEELTHKHWERASLSDLRRAIQQRRRELVG